MKKIKLRISSIIIYIIAFLSIIVMCYQVYIASSTSLPEYSTLNISQYGSSLLYEGLKDAGYPVVQSYEELTPLKSIHDIQILIYPDYEYYDDEKILKWVEKGGRLVLFDYSMPYFNDSGEIEYYDLYDAEVDLYSYTVGYGEIFVISPEYAENQTLVSERSIGEHLSRTFRIWGYEKIVFNEFYHGFAGVDNPWKSLNVNYKILFVQFSILVAVFLFFKGKRFGTPKMLYSEIERSESEETYAISNLYYRNKVTYVPVNSYFSKLTLKCSIYFNVAEKQLSDNNYELLLTLWEKENLKFFQELKEIVTYILDNSNKNKRLRDSKLTYFVKLITLLEKQLQ